MARRTSVDRKNRGLVKNYGITLKERDVMWAEQGGVCAICHEVPREERTAGGGINDGICVDHDHVTGRIRGLLCSRCNWMLGNARDNVLILEAGAKYLQERAR